MCREWQIQGNVSKLKNTEPHIEPGFMPEKHKQQYVVNSFVGPPYYELSDDDEPTGNTTGSSNVQTGAALKTLAFHI